MRCTGTNSSGIILVGSSRSNSNLNSSRSSTICTPSSHSGSRRSQLIPKDRGDESPDPYRRSSALHPENRVQTEQRLPMKFYEARFAFFVHKTERMNAKPFHHAEAARNCPIRHHPHNHVHRLRHQRNEVPEGIVSRPACGISLCGSGFTAWTRSGNFIAS